MATPRRALARANNFSAFARANSIAAPRAPRTLLLGLAAALAALLAVVVGPVSATQAAPQLSISQVQARIDALNTQAEKITEAYNLKRGQLKDLQRQQTVAQHELASNQKALTAAGKQLVATAQAVYRSGGLSDSVFNPAADPQTYLDQSMILDAVSRSQSEAIATAEAAGHNVEVARAHYTAKAAQVRQSLDQIRSDKAHIDSLLAQAHNLLSSLRAADRARLAAQQASVTTHAIAARGSYHGPASGAAGVAVRFAYAQLGKPYVYGAAGPSSYDCSGLTMAAWGAAGVSLPHNAAMQQSMTHYVSQGELQPGDLVFFGSPAYHVGMYVGGGNIIEAPHTGDVVKIVSLSYMPNYSGAGRP